MAKVQLSYGNNFWWELGQNMTAKNVSLFIPRS